MYEKLSPFTRDAIVFSPAPPPTEPKANYPGFKPETTIIPKGFQKKPDSMKAPCDIEFQRDVAVILRDGIKIYVDIFRPVTDEKVPVLINSTIFGKSGSYMYLDQIPNRARVLPEWTSGFQSWEAAEPFYWCNAGYAVVNVDMRGIGMSEGDACYFGSQDASDNYDIIEHFGEADWSNGKVAMVGNSWLGITQWYAAALNPPHLAAIAPWEGHGNMYEDEYMRGGIPNYAAARINLSFGLGKMEDLGANMRKFPLINEFWEDKIADFEKVTIPAYVAASYTSPLHTHGTFEGFRKIASENKWLRVHNTQEWADFYNPKYSDDLKKFFDYFLKGIENGWMETPYVRVCVLDPGGKDLIDRPEKDFPLPQQELKTYYLHTEDGTLKTEAAKEESSFKYEGEPQNTVYFKHDLKATLVENNRNTNEVSRATFTLPIDKETEVTGYIKVKLWVEAENNNDMDVFVRVANLDKNDNVLFHDAILCKFTGPGGMLRVSQRQIDPDKSTVCEPYHPHKTLSYLSKGEIVPIEIGLWPTGQVFHKGEKFQVIISGYDHLGTWGNYCEPENFNKGNHIIHSGGKFDSHIVIPVIPSK